MKSLTDDCRFWFFAARKNSDTAPLALWFNGGVSPSLYYGGVQISSLDSLVVRVWLVCSKNTVPVELPTTALPSLSTRTRGIMTLMFSTSINQLAQVSLMGPQQSEHHRKLLQTFGNSYKYFYRTNDSLTFRKESSHCGLNRECGLFLVIYGFDYSLKIWWTLRTHFRCVSTYI